MFAILSEVLLIEIQKEIHHFAGWEGGGLRGTKIVNKNFVPIMAEESLVRTILLILFEELTWFKTEALMVMGRHLPATHTQSWLGTPPI